MKIKQQKPSLYIPHDISPEINMGSFHYSYYCYYYYYLLTEER